MTIRTRLAAAAAALAAVRGSHRGRLVPRRVPQHATAIFAGGCFWCMEPPFDALDGVMSTTSGYTGGQTKNPTYEQVSEGRTGHTEAIRVVYDPSKISYDKLLEVFWRNIDPLDGGGQFCDRGPQYRSGIFFQSEDERKLADDVEGEGREQAVGSSGDRDRGRGSVLRSRRLSPGLLQEESGALQVVQMELRSRPATGENLGRRHAR